MTQAIIELLSIPGSASVAMPALLPVNTKTMFLRTITALGFFRRTRENIRMFYVQKSRTTAINAKKHHVYQFALSRRPAMTQAVS
jgi:hypothetical protein